MAGPPKDLASLLRARRGYLATTGSDGTPHLVPVCFTWAGDVIWTSIDAKPKSTENLQRVKDIKDNPQVSLLVDRWDEDWNRLAWLQARGKATLLTKGSEVDRVHSALRDKYAQYREVEMGGLIRVDVERWVGWSAEHS